MQPTNRAEIPISCPPYSKELWPGLTSRINNTVAALAAEKLNNAEKNKTTQGI